MLAWWQIHVLKSSRHRRRRAQAASLDINKILFLINHVYHVACGMNCLHSANNEMLECKKDCMSKLYQCTMIKAKPVMECNGVAISCCFSSSAQPVASCVPEPGWAFIASWKTCHLTSPGFRIRIQPLRTNRIRIQTPLSWKFSIYFMMSFNKKLLPFSLFDGP